MVKEYDSMIFVKIKDRTRPPDDPDEWMCISRNPETGKTKGGFLLATIKTDPADFLWVKEPTPFSLRNLKDITQFMEYLER